MSVNEKMTAIADAMRSYTCGTEKLGLEDMAYVVDDVFDVGVNRGKAICEAKHYTASVLGSGTNSLSVAIPFQPDTILLFTVSPYTEAQGNVIRVFSMDFRSCTNRTGVTMHTTTSHSNGANFATINMDEYYAYENGVLTIQTPSSVAGLPIWSSNVRYAVVAAKFSETAKELVEEQIRLLPDTVPSGNSGTMQYKAARINALFTDMEWATLIATKPKWTFSLV